MGDFEVDMSMIEEAASYIRQLTPEQPLTCIVLGSGLGPMAERCEIIASAKFQEIPFFPVPTTPGHEGRLLVARVGSTLTYMMQGRYHFYEGYNTVAVTFPLRVLAHLGIRNLILTNAAGGVNQSMKPGDLMVITDHLSMFCKSPLIGRNLDEFGPRFPDQSSVYTPSFIETLKRVGEHLGITFHEGIYAYMTGPQYETPAEIRALRMLGADAVGMSTVPEAIVAAHCGLKVLAMSCITNYAAGISREPLSHAEVIAVGAMASDKSIALVEAFLAEIDE